jgi:hypothetical protein
MMGPSLARAPVRAALRFRDIDGGSADHHCACVRVFDSDFANSKLRVIAAPFFT